MSGRPSYRESSRSYSDLIAIDLTKATRSHFEEKLGELYNVSGDTRVKAVRFFLNAAEYASIPLSVFIVPKDGKTNGSARRAKSTTPRPRSTKKAITAPPKPLVNDSKPSGTSKSVALQSGGALTVSATADWFALNAEDRTFVFGLIPTNWRSMPKSFRRKRRKRPTALTVGRSYRKERTGLITLSRSRHRFVITIRFRG